MQLSSGLAVQRPQCMLFLNGYRHRSAFKHWSGRIIYFRSISTHAKINFSDRQESLTVFSIICDPYRLWLACDMAIYKCDLHWHCIMFCGCLIVVVTAECCVHSCWAYKLFVDGLCVAEAKHLATAVALYFIVFYVFKPLLSKEQRKDVGISSALCMPA